MLDFAFVLVVVFAFLCMFLSSFFATGNKWVPALTFALCSGILFGVAGLSSFNIVTESCDSVVNQTVSYVDGNVTLTNHTGGLVCVKSQNVDEGLAALFGSLCLIMLILGFAYTYFLVWGGVQGGS
jgi:hypothetical protein